ncbi:MAG: type II toxin-antitoxin system RelE/ParE family toxin [Pseudomonadota bacterium]
MYRVEFKPSAGRQLDDLDKAVRARVDRKIDELAENPRPVGAKKLKGSSELWRVRAGDYRIVYSIHDDVLTVLVVKIGNRRDVYR